MSTQALAIKYRPTKFEDVVEQGSTIKILQEQLINNSVKHSYLFCGGAGTGKTTCARIFANEINHGEGHPVEMDAASNNGVDDVRNIIDQAQIQALDSEYKVFIIDECHSLSNTAWQAMLKLIEEPPEKAIFIFCTTDPQKIPSTIISRIQRYDFQRISQQGIADRLCYVLTLEAKETPDIVAGASAIDYLAKQAQGGMRDALTMLDKCLSYSHNLTVENIVTALGVADYDMMFSLREKIKSGDNGGVVEIIERLYMSGIDLKQFMRQFQDFILDILKFSYTGSYEFVKIPLTYKIKDVSVVDYKLLTKLVEVNANIRWETDPKYRVEAELLIFMRVFEEIKE